MLHLLRAWEGCVFETYVIGVNTGRGPKASSVDFENFVQYSRLAHLPFSY